MMPIMRMRCAILTIAYYITVKIQSLPPAIPKIFHGVLQFRVHSYG